MPAHIDPMLIHWENNKLFKRRIHPYEVQSRVDARFKCFLNKQNNLTARKIKLY